MNEDAQIDRESLKSIGNNTIVNPTPVNKNVFG